MDLTFKNELSLVPDLHHRLRHLRWFRMTFRNSVRAVTERYGIAFDVDDERLAAIFFDWVETVNDRKVYAGVDRRDFIIYASGLALTELIRHNPVRARQSSSHPDAIEPAVPDVVRFWPEGFVYTNFCVCAISAMFEQEFGEAPELSASADDLRTWWSYRENVTEMPSYAVAYLDSFLGAEPTWVAPDQPEMRKAMRAALAQAAEATPIERA
ncbi:MAG: hypothetical protein WBF87_12180 [Mesorhizobium sp.]